MLTIYFYTAVSICNMNQALKSVASKIPRTSEEYAILQSICRFSVDKNVTNSMVGTWDTFRKVLLSVCKVNIDINYVTVFCLACFLKIIMISMRYFTFVQKSRLHHPVNECWSLVDMVVKMLTV